MIAPWLIATAAHALTGRHPRLRAHPAAHREPSREMGIS
jgi:hypothetical protein